MYGQIVKVRPDLGLGVLVTDEGRKYRFKTADIMNRDVSLDGQDVDFLPIAGRAQSIIVLAGSPWTAFGAPTSASTSRSTTGGRHVGA
jgi:hypothetical protein